MTKEEIIRMYKVDAPQMDLRGRKRETKRKINHFFKIIDESKKTFIEQPKARSNRAALIFYASKKHLYQLLHLSGLWRHWKKRAGSFKKLLRMWSFMTNLLKRSISVAFHIS
jgi:hypothetical protein